MFQKYKFSEFLENNSKFIVISFFIIIFAQASLISLVKSPSWDEMSFIGYGRFMIERGSLNFHLSVGEPVLNYYLNSLFLILLKVDDAIWLKGDYYVPISTEFIFHSGYEPKLILFLARLPNIILSILLAYFLFRCSKEMYGIKAGFFTLFLYSFSPMMLANIRVAQTELPMACFGFISLYYFWKFYNNPQLKYLILSSLTVSLAMLFKIPAIVFVIVYTAFILLNKKPAFKNKIATLVILFSIMFLTIWAAYGFQFQTIKSTLPEHYTGVVYQKLEKIENGMLKGLGPYIFEEVPVPFPSFMAYLGNVFRNADRGVTGYFFGQVFEPKEKPLYYFITAFLIKTPIPTLFFLLLTLIFLSQIRSKKSTELLIVLPLMLLFLLLSINKQSYALRHMLVIYPLLFLFISKSANIKVKKQKIFNLFLILLSAWYLFSSVYVFPNHVSYFNEFVGGSKNGYKYLLSDNVDRGEDLSALKKYLTKNNIGRINLSYHGNLDPIEYGISYDYMPSACFQDWVPGSLEFAQNCKLNFTEDCSARKGIVAISVTNLQNRFLKNRSCFNWLKGNNPIRIIGNSIHVYNITVQ